MLTSQSAGNMWVLSAQAFCRLLFIGMELISTIAYLTFQRSAGNIVNCKVFQHAPHLHLQYLGFAVTCLLYPYYQ